MPFKHEPLITSYFQAPLSFAEAVPMAKNASRPPDPIQAAQFSYSTGPSTGQGGALSTSWKTFSGLLSLPILV